MFLQQKKIIVVVIFAIVLKTMCTLLWALLSCLSFRVLRITSKCTQNNNVQAESIDSATKNDSLSTPY